jgi:soluble lytic murein transglycosylase
MAFDSLMDAVIQQESHGNGTAVSPKGALGSTQLMPATAKEMATKLGLPFRPDMLRSNDPGALKYQRALASAYLREGLERTGNITDALHYYHGGPDRSQWGPLTRAYANEVLARLQ